MENSTGLQRVKAYTELQNLCDQRVGAAYIHSHCGLYNLKVIRFHGGLIPLDEFVQQFPIIVHMIKHITTTLCELTSEGQKIVDKELEKTMPKYTIIFE